MTNSIEILYQDQWLMIINKPEGLLSTSYTGGKAKTAESIINNIMRKNGTWSKNHHAYCVHRLDCETSGIMIFALTELAQKKIMNTWHTMVKDRLYRAVGENPILSSRDSQHNNFNPLPDQGLIDDPLAQNAYKIGYVPNKNEKVKTVPARTNYKVISRGKIYTLFELNLDTGKKNQIRAHLAKHGYPLAGDQHYRAKTDPFNRLALHARTLSFIHPFTNESMKFEIPEPENWLKIVESSQTHQNTKEKSQNTKEKHAKTKEKNRTFKTLNLQENHTTSKEKNSNTKMRDEKIISQIEKMQASRKKDKSHFYDDFIQKKR